MRKSKPFTREQYLKKFSRAVRWRLPASEAEEAIADYRELIFQEERDESKLLEELGEPIQAANLLTDVRVYRRWLWVFGILAFGLFLYAKWAWTGMANVHLFQIRSWWYPVWVMAVGLPLSLVWFRRHGQKYGPLSKRLLLTMAVVLAVGVGTMAWTYYLFDPQVLESIAQTEDYVIYIEPWQVGVLRELLIDGGLAYALIALVGLVQAKRCDRRWLALYVLCVTLAAMSGFIEFNLLRMDVTINPPDLQAYVFARILPVGAVGLVGTGGGPVLKKDLLELCLLQLLAGGDKYGYEVLTPLRAAFPDTQESAIYALLRGLGKSGCTTWYMAPGGGGPDRKYYQLTAAGRNRLEELKSDWRNMRDAIATFGVE